MKMAIAVALGLAMATPAWAEPGWYADNGPLGTYAESNEDIALEVWCGMPELSPVEVTYTDYDSDNAKLPDDIYGATLVIAAGAGPQHRYPVVFEEDNDDFMMSGDNARAVINMALQGEGLTTSIIIRGRRYIPAHFDNTGMDIAQGPLNDCLKAGN